MKNKLKRSVLLLTFTFASAFIKAQAPSSQKYPETVIIRVIEIMYEGMAVRSDSKLITVMPDNTTEVKSLENVNIAKNNNEEQLKQNLVKIRTEVQKWQNAGFIVKSSSATGETIMITTIILEKN